jgi:hypothetical protein
MIYVVRPYAGLPSDGTGNDRYVNLCLEPRARGMTATLACSTFMPNKQASRTASEIDLNRNVLPFVAELDSPAYERNISWQRVMHELVFGLKALQLAVRLKPRMVIVGEPLSFVGWIFVAYGPLFGVEVAADVIDIWPEADTPVPAGSRAPASKHFMGCCGYRALCGSAPTRA